MTQAQGWHLIGVAWTILAAVTGSNWLMLPALLTMICALVAEGGES